MCEYHPDFPTSNKLRKQCETDCESQRIRRLKSLKHGLSDQSSNDRLNTERLTHKENLLEETLPDIFTN